MINDAISFALSLLVAALVVFPLGGVLRRRPTAFYLAALLLAALFEAYQLGGLFGNSTLQLFAEPLRKGYIASCLLAAVMFCGALPARSDVRAKIQPIRAELSILSLVMYLPHILAYLPVYLPRLGQLLGVNNPLSCSLVVAFVLLGIYVTLAILSLKKVRMGVPFRVWKALQHLSYLMVVLLCLHVWLVLGQGALLGGTPDSVIALALYTCVIATYAVLRVRRAVVDRAEIRNHFPVGSKQNV